MANDKYEEILAGTVALGYLDCTLLEYARGIKYYVEQEARKPNGDSHLVNMLRRAACVGWENIKLFKALSTERLSPSDAEQLSELRRACQGALELQTEVSQMLRRWAEDAPRSALTEPMIAHAERIAKASRGLRVALAPKQQEGKETR